MKLGEFLKRYGLLYSKELGIDVKKEPNKWLLASVLFGGRISTTIAKKTFAVYDKEGLTSPEKIIETSHRKLVEIHGKGGYARYDGVTAEYIMGIARKLLDEYDGNVKKLDELSQNPNDLELHLIDFRGIGSVTARIFLRELRGIWKNADPEPTIIEILAAKKLGILKSDENALEELKKYWHNNKVKGYDFRNFETALVRYGLDVRRKKS